MKKRITAAITAAAMAIMMLAAIPVSSSVSNYFSVVLTAESASTWCDGWKSNPVTITGDGSYSITLNIPTGSISSPSTLIPVVENLHNLTLKSEDKVTWDWVKYPIPQISLDSISINGLLFDIKDPITQFFLSDWEWQVYVPLWNSWWEPSQRISGDVSIHKNDGDGDDFPILILNNPVNGNHVITLNFTLSELGILTEPPTTTSKTEEVYRQVQGVNNEQLAAIVADGRIPENITGLDLSHCPWLTDITPLAELTELRTLGLIMNSLLSDITPLADLTNLERLHINGTIVSDISPLSGLVNLQEAYLAANQIVDITPLASLTKLKNLNLHNNQIRDISVLQTMTWLEFFSIDGNPIGVPVETTSPPLTTIIEPTTTEPPTTTTSVPATTTPTTTSIVIPQTPPQTTTTEPTKNSVLTPEIIQAILASGVTAEIELGDGTIIRINPQSINSTQIINNFNININVFAANENNQDENKQRGISQNSLIIEPATHGEFGLELEFDITAEQLKKAGLNSKNAELFYMADNGDVKTDIGRIISRNNDGSITVGISQASYYVLSADMPVPPASCECKNCDNCGFLGGVYGFGKILGTDSVTINDALEILKYLAKLPSYINDNVNSLNAARILTPNVGTPTINDALTILKKLAKLPNEIDGT